MPSHVSDAVIRRLPGYYRHLRELEQAGVTQISSQELGERMSLTASQIRQDINCFGGFGRKGYGYNVSALKDHIAEILGLDKPHHMIIVGAGSIGQAVARYPSFVRSGFQTDAIFDVNPAVIGKDLGGIAVQDAAGLEAYVQSHPVDIAVLAVPAVAAQEMLNRLSALGIDALWNFAPTDLEHPKNMMVVNVHLSDSLQILSYRMAHREENI